MTPPTNSGATKTRHTHRLPKMTHIAFFSPLCCFFSWWWGPAWETMWYGWEKHDCSLFPIIFSCKLAEARENCNSEGYDVQFGRYCTGGKKEYRLKNSFLVSFGYKIYGGFAEPQQNSKVNSLQAFQRVIQTSAPLQIVRHKMLFQSCGWTMNECCYFLNPDIVGG